MSILQSFRYASANPELNIDVNPKLSSPIYTIGTDTYTYPGQYIYPIGRALTFTAQFRANDESIPIEYEWNMGNGTIIYGPEVQFTFCAPSRGILVGLSVLDNRGRHTRTGIVVTLLNLTTVISPSNRILAR